MPLPTNIGAYTQMSKQLPTAAFDQIVADFHGRIGFYIEDLTTGITHEYNADQRFPTASVCKVPVMIELFRQVDTSTLSLDERRRLQGNISTHGSGTLKLMEDAPELTLRDYCRLMISISDNMATDFLLGVVGLESVNATLDAMGFPNTRTSVTLGRYHYRMFGMDDVPCTRENDVLQHKRAETHGTDFNSVSFQDSLENNVATPRDMGSILKQLHAGQVVSPQASAAMIEMLKMCNDRRMIPRDLKPDIPTAHKIGSSGRIKGDVGLVSLPTGPLVVSAFALASDDGVRGDEAIAEISRLAVETLSPESIAQ